MTIAATLKKALEQHGVHYALIAHPKTASSRESARAAHVYEDHIAKAVIVKDDQGYAMVIIPGDHWVKLEALHKALDRDFEFATEEEITRLFPDCHPGAVPPMGVAYGLETYLDDDLTTLANVYFESGNHRHLVHVSGEAFRALCAGVRRGHFSHNDT
ncbi:MAG: YbaK/EbsC family protein [Pseudomonadota bacterium]